MNKKFLLLTALLLVMAAAGFSQDTSRLAVSNHLKKNTNTINPIVSPDTIHPKRNTGKPHSAVDSNTGIQAPNTTSGTLNSTVNPNTQFVIPIHKNKKKSNFYVLPAPVKNKPSK